MRTFPTSLGCWGIIWWSLRSERTAHLQLFWFVCQINSWLQRPKAARAAGLQAAETQECQGLVLQGSQGFMGPGCWVRPCAHQGTSTCYDCPPGTERGCGEKWKPSILLHGFLKERERLMEIHLPEVAGGGPGTKKKEKGIDAKQAASLWSFISALRPQNQQVLLWSLS